MLLVLVKEMSKNNFKKQIYGLGVNLYYVHHSSISIYLKRDVHIQGRTIKFVDSS